VDLELKTKFANSKLAKLAIETFPPVLSHWGPSNIEMPIFRIKQGCIRVNWECPCGLESGSWCLCFLCFLRLATLSQIGWWFEVRFAASCRQQATTLVVLMLLPFLHKQSLRWSQWIRSDRYVKPPAPRGLLGEIRANRTKWSRCHIGASWTCPRPQCVKCILWKIYKTNNLPVPWWNWPPRYPGWLYTFLATRVCLTMNGKGQHQKGVHCHLT
jgi:hypothetical protein